MLTSIESRLSRGLSMPSVKPARGRPKGTGLDDRSVVQNVIQLVESNPALKPTTAIKSLGVTDPSAIRRLRDKYNMSVKASAAATASKHISRTDDTARSPRTMALGTSSTALRSAPIEQPKSAVTAQAVQHRAARTMAGSANGQTEAQQKHSAAANRASSLAWFSLWTDIGMHSVAASLKAQWIIYEHVLRSPPVAAALSSHAVFTDFAAAWCALSPDPGKTIH
jgi:hypothetical protein